MIVIFEHISDCSIRVSRPFTGQDCSGRKVTPPSLDPPIPAGKLLMLHCVDTVMQQVASYPEVKVLRW